MTGLSYRLARRVTLTGTATALAAAGGLMGLISAGCGSGGGSAGSTIAGTTTRAASTVNLYVTDGFREDWSHVQVTLYKIEASTDSGATFTTIFSNTTGQSVDLASLGTAAQLLSSATVPAATITNVRVTLGDTVSLTQTSDGSVKTVSVDNTLPNVTVGNGQAVFTFAASTAMSPGKLSNLVIDFKLAAFELVSGKVRPSLGEAAPGVFNGKQGIAHISGTVSNYVAGTGFDLTPDCGQHGGSAGAGTPAVIHVALSSSTAITTDASATALANGVTVTVEGNADTVTQIVSATVVQVGNTDGPHGPGGPAGPGGPTSTGTRPVQVMGTVGTVGTPAGSFTVTVRDGEHLPASANGMVTVQTSAATTFDQGHTPATLTAVAAGAYVFAVGTLDPTTGILTATTVAVLPAAPTGQQWPGPSGPH